jgi:type VI secretion system protein ImpF
VASVFDRLSDDSPDRPDDQCPNEPLTPSMLRAVVLRDLGALFNTTRCDPQATAADDDDGRSSPRCLVQRSVLGYGLPALAGRPATSCDALALARALGEAIGHFEPRLEAASILVVPEARVAAPRQVLRYRIEGRLRACAWPETLVMRTEIDLDSGATRVAEQA